VDYTFILRGNILGNRKRIYDHYTTAFLSFEYFCQILDNTTESYECLVIKNGGESNKLCDQVFWYKAEIHEDRHPEEDQGVNRVVDRHQHEEEGGRVHEEGVGEERGQAQEEGLGEEGGRVHEEGLGEERGRVQAEELR
jgi:hypothetical protein